MYKLFDKEIRGRFFLPSGVIATNADVVRWAIKNIPQLGIVVGKSTTIDPKPGNREDIIVQETRNSLRNAVGYTNPGLEVMLEDFKELVETLQKTYS